MCCSNPVVLIECLTCLPLQWISVLVLSMFVHATHRQPVLELAMSAKRFRSKVYLIKLYWWIVYQQIAVNIVCSHCGMQQFCNHLWNMQFWNGTETHCSRGPVECCNILLKDISCTPTPSVHIVRYSSYDHCVSFNITGSFPITGYVPCWIDWWYDEP